MINHPSRFGLIAINRPNRSARTTTKSFDLKTTQYLTDLQAILICIYMCVCVALVFFHKHIDIWLSVLLWFDKQTKTWLVCSWEWKGCSEVKKYVCYRHDCDMRQQILNHWNLTCTSFQSPSCELLEAYLRRTNPMLTAPTLAQCKGFWRLISARDNI